MRVLIQRVRKASVTVAGDLVGSIDQGLLVFVGVEKEDNEDDLNWLCTKICGLRIFSDEAGKMNHSIKDIGGGILVVSQFTLHASTKKGNRPSFISAAHPDLAEKMYDAMISKFRAMGIEKVEAGQFGASMDVALLNDGPVTIWIDSKRRE